MNTVLIIFLTFVCLVSTENICGNWESFKDEKCFTVIDEGKLMTYEEAVHRCSLSESGSGKLLTIHSKEEQEFVVKYIFETRKIDQNIWLGLKNINNTFEWIDKTSVEFTNWANGMPSNKTDRNCFELSSDISPVGKWVDIQCDRKLIAVCQRFSYNYLEKKLLGTLQLLKETQNQLINKVKQLTETSSNLTACLNRVVSPSHSFTDSDGKQRAFIFPEVENNKSVNWDEANYICNKNNATLVEINTPQKQAILESFLTQFDAKHFYWFWLNAHKDSSGQWKWLRSGNDVSFLNWVSGSPYSYSDYTYLIVILNPPNFGKWANNPKNSFNYLLCETEVHP